MLVIYENTEENWPQNGAPGNPTSACHPAWCSPMHYNPLSKTCQPVVHPSYYILVSLYARHLVLKPIVRNRTEIFAEIQKTTFPDFPCSTRWVTLSYKEITLIKEDFPVISPCWVYCTTMIVLSLKCFSVTPGIISIVLLGTEVCLIGQYLPGSSSLYFSKFRAMVANFPWTGASPDSQDY